VSWPRHRPRHRRRGRGGAAPSLGYLAGLDGLRGIAVLLVLGYHAGVPGLEGGFLGVDVFFVLSGFLITSLLLVEQANSGSIRLGRFWVRRARRLLPGLFAMLAALAAYATVARASDLAQLRSDALATLGYFANWHAIFAGQGYFAQQARPSPLLHTWSLSIEEQFYLVWPPLLALLLRRRRAQRWALAVAVAGAAASAWAMAALYHAGAGLSRVYYGTDTRAQELLVGAALAVVLRRRPSPASVGAGSAASALGLAAASGAAAIVATTTGSSSLIYRGLLVGLAVLVAGVVGAVAVAPAAPLARVLAAAPLRLTGRISYGLYLWHWPVFVYLDHARSGLSGAGLVGARLGVTFALATCSFVLLEEPIRSGRWLAGARPGSLLPAAAGAAATVLLVAAIPAAPGAALPDAAGLRAAASGPALAGAAGRPPVRVMWVGDSMAFLLAQAFYYADHRYGGLTINDATVGCGLARGGPISYAGSIIPSDASCGDWRSLWRNELSKDHPDVAVVFVGPWEVVDRVHDGTWMHIGQPAYDRYEEALLDQAVQILSSGGARVALFTSPYYDHGEQPDGRPWPQDDPARVRRLNQLIYRTAASWPGVASVIPLGQMLSPGDRYAQVIDGRPARTADGLHVSVPESLALVPRIYPELVDLGLEARAARGRPGPAPAGLAAR
jgi:peptidoglycan/LPS O-acetylase OafA/YrhL